MTEKAVRWFDDAKLKARESALAEKRKEAAALRSREENLEAQLVDAHQVHDNHKALASIGRAANVSGAESRLHDLEDALNKARGSRMVLEAELPVDERALEHLRRAIAVECCQAIHSETASLVGELEGLLSRVVSCNERLDALHVLARVSFESQGDFAAVTKSAGVPPEAGFSFSLRAHVSTAAALTDWRTRANEALATARRQFDTRQRGLAGKVA